jgi:hypothetical protein
MNMISTGAFQSEMDASNKQPTLAEKFAAVWEKKNAKAARAGGLSLMALSLAACGSDDATTTTATTTTTTTTTTTVAGQTLTLTSKIDSLTGGAGDDTIDATATNEGGVANVQTLGATDTVDGGAGTDTMVVEYSVDTTPMSISNVEHIKITDIDAAVNTEVINLVNVTGMSELSVIGNTNLADLNNVANIVTLNLTNTTGGANLDYAAAAVAGTADAQTVNVQSTTAGTLTLDAGVESLTINSAGGTANTLAAYAGAGVTSMTITGAAALTITATLPTTVTTVDGSAATGILTLTQTGAVVSNISTGSGNDVIDLSGNFVDGTTAASRDTVAAGAGTDALILTAAEAVAVGTVAQFSTVTGIETVKIDDDATGAGTFNMVNLGIDTLEFDAALGTHSVIAVSGGEIQLDLADTNNNARSYSISGTGTTDSLTLDINGVDVGGGAMTFTGIETLTIATSGTAVMDGASVMTATAATEKLIITGTAGTLALGALTTDQIDSTGFSGTSIGMGIMGQMTMLTGGSGAETIIGSTAADTLSGGAGADFLQNQAVTVDDSSNDIITGGAGFDTITLVGSSIGTATNYLGSSQVTDYTVGTTAANTDLLRFTAANTAYNDDNDADVGLAEESATDAVAVGDAVNIQTVAVNAAGAAASATTINCIKLTTSTAFTTSVQGTFNAAIGTATVSGFAASSNVLFLMHDATNAKMVIGTVDSNTGDTTTIQTGDTVELVATVDMTATDYALIDTDNFAAFIA